MDDGFVTKCAAQITSLELPLAPATIHWICTRNLGALLLDRCNSDDRTKCSYAFEVLGEYLYRVGTRITPDIELVAEATQASLIEIYRSTENVRNPDAFLGYCMTVLRHELGRLGKKTAQEQRSQLSLDSPIGEGADTADPPTMGELIPSTEQPPDEFVAEIDEHSGLWRCLNSSSSLSNRDRVILVWRYLWNMTINEIAQRLKVARNVIDTAMARAKARLKKDLDFIACLRLVGYGTT